MRTNRPLPSPSTRSLTRAGLTVLTLMLMLVAALPASAEPGEDEEPQPYASREDEDPVPAFARVRYLDGNGTVVREDGTSDALSTNLPVYAGDRIDTRDGARVELQLPDGTVLRLDSDTEVELYELLDPAWREPSPSLIGLSRGSVQLDVDVAREGDAVRIDTPAASIYVMERGSLRIDVDSDDTTRVSVQRGRVELAGERDSVAIGSGQRASVRPGGRPGSAWRYNVYAADAFDRWVTQRDDLYHVRIARGREYEELPDEVRPYYGELSGHGRWVWADDWGYVWRPSVDASWQPYTLGYWSRGPWGPVWVSYDSWGWCTYRYGRWDWRAGWGWVWMPGRIFAPAHVYWYYGPDYVGWCPRGWWDGPVRISISIGWGHRWFDDCPWWFAGYDHFYYRDVRRYQPPRSAVIADLRRGGVVSRRAVVDHDGPGRGGVGHGGPGHDGRPGRGAAIPRDGAGRGKNPGGREALDRSVFDRAKQAVGRRDGGARLVDGALERDAQRPRRPGQDQAAGRSPREAGAGNFRERERQVIERRGGVRGDAVEDPAARRRVDGDARGAAAGGRKPGGAQPTERGTGAHPRGGQPQGDARETPATRGEIDRRSPQAGDTSGPDGTQRSAPRGQPRRVESRERQAPRGDDRSPEARETPRDGDGVRDLLGSVGRPLVQDDRNDGARESERARTRDTDQEGQRSAEQERERQRSQARDRELQRFQEQQRERERELAREQERHRDDAQAQERQQDAPRDRGDGRGEGRSGGQRDGGDDGPRDGDDGGKRDGGGGKHDGNGGGKHDGNGGGKHDGNGGGKRDGGKKR